MPDLVYGLRLRVAGQRAAASWLRRFGSEVRRAGGHSDVAATLAGRQAAATKRLGDEAAKSGRKIRGFGAEAEKAGRKTRTFSQRLLEAHGRILRYAGVGSLAIGVTQFGRATLEAADANVELRNRLRLVTDSEAELGRVRCRPGGRRTQRAGVAGCCTVPRPAVFPHDDGRADGRRG